jgi:hypothetical protein
LLAALNCLCFSVVLTADISCGMGGASASRDAVLFCYLTRRTVV